MKSRDTDQWMSYRHLPENLKERIRRYEQYRWQETSGVDEEQLLMNLPKDLRRDIKRHLCLSLLMRVCYYILPPTPPHPPRPFVLRLIQFIRIYILLSICKIVPQVCANVSRQRTNWTQCHDPSFFLPDISGQRTIGYSAMIYLLFLPNFS